MLTHFPAQTHYSEFKPLGPQITLRVPRLCLSCPLETPPDSHCSLALESLHHLPARGGGRRLCCNCPPCSWAFPLFPPGLRSRPAQWMPSMGHPRLDDQELSRSKARARARPGLGCCHEWPLFPAGPGVGGGSVGKAAQPSPYLTQDHPLISPKKKKVKVSLSMSDV